MKLTLLKINALLFLNSDLKGFCMSSALLFVNDVFIRHISKNFKKATRFFFFVPLKKVRLYFVYVELDVTTVY